MITAGRFFLISPPMEGSKLTHHYYNNILIAIPGRTILAWMGAAPGNKIAAPVMIDSLYKGR
jgi:hypothetical protein